MIGVRILRIILTVFLFWCSLWLQGCVNQASNFAKLSLPPTAANLNVWTNKTDYLQRNGTILPLRVIAYAPSAICAGYLVLATLLDFMACVQRYGLRTVPF